MNGNGFTGYGINTGAQVYGAQRTIPMTQPLTPAEIQQLKQKAPAFSLAVDPTELLASYCTHKEGNKIVVTQNASGELYCPICNATFSPNWTTEQVQEAAKIMEDILQTIKLQYLNIPEGVAKQYFAILPLLRKAPKLYEISCNEFAKQEQGNPIYDQNSQRGFAMLNMLANPMAMYNPAMMGMQVQADPNMVYAQQQPVAMPMYAQQPMMYAQPQPMVTGAMPQGVNPFGGVGVDPSAAQQPAMTAQPAQATDGAVTNSKVLNV